MARETKSKSSATKLETLAEETDKDTLEKKLALLQLTDRYDESLWVTICIK